MNTHQNEVESQDRIGIDATQLMGFDRLLELAPKSTTDEAGVDRLALAGRLLSKVGTVEL